MNEDLFVEEVECPYGACTWSTSFDPTNDHSKALAEREIEAHRKAHREVLHQ